MGKGNKGLHMVAFILLAVGGLNWLAEAFLGGSDLGDWLGGGAVATVVYTLVGLAAIYEIAMHGKHCKMCKPDGMGSGPATPPTSGM